MNYKKIALIAAKIIIYAIIILFILVCAFCITVTVMSKKDSDGTAVIFGYEMRLVASPSMEQCELTDVSGYEIKSIPTKSLIFVTVVPDDEKEAEEWYSRLRVGDVLTFKYVYTKQETITHRIVEISKKTDGGYIIELEGDNKNSEEGVLRQTIDTSQTDSPNYVIGKVTWQSYVLGLLIYALKTPVGIACFVIIPCAVIIIYEIIRIARAIGADKKEKARQLQEKQQSEIEELKKQLAQLQKPPQDGDGT